MDSNPIDRIQRQKNFELIFYPYRYNVENLNTFCIVPFQNLFVSPENKLFPCAESQENKTEFGSAFQSNEADFSNWKKSGELNRLRNEMVQGKRPKECFRCFKNEDFGKSSSRILKNKKFQTEVESIKQKYLSSGPETLGLRTIDIRLGNFCNLQCRMCSPTSTDKLIPEWEFIAKDSFKSKSSNDFDWYKNDSLWEQFFLNHRNLEHIVFGGGEPFINVWTEKILDFAIKHGASQKISLMFHSNLTVWNEALIEKISSNFRKVEIQASIDGVEKVNSFIRYPAKWEKISLNLSKLNEWAGSPKHRARINCTISALNLNDVENLIPYSISHKNFAPVILSVLSSPHELHISNLPNQFKISARQNLFNLQQELLASSSLPQKWSKLDTDSFFDDLESLIRRIELVDHPEGLVSLRQFISTQDSFRKHKLGDYIPHLGSIFN